MISPVGVAKISADGGFGLTLCSDRAVWPGGYNRGGPLRSEARHPHRPRPKSYAD